MISKEQKFIEEDLETLRGAMNAAGVLTPLEKSILVQRFGLGEGNENEKEKILKEIGVNHKLTTERVRQIQMMAQKKLRRVLEARV